MALAQNWLDRAVGALSPRTQLARVRARIATELVQRHYEAASTGRRTQNWNRNSGDANTVNGGRSLASLREVARDLVRNNPFAEAGVATIVDHTIGTGIMAKPYPANERAAQRWKRWADTTACDADGRENLAGLQKLVLRTVAESGEVLVRRRMRRLEDGLPIPLQLQVIEPDLLDTAKNIPQLPNGGQIIQGVEFGPLGTRDAYWLYPSHPGSSMQFGGSIFPGSKRIPASEVLHVFKRKRPGQVRGVSWLAPVILRLKELDEYEDATLMKQKIAACLAVVTSDVDGSAAALGTGDDTNNPGVDTLEPGAVLNIPPGRSVDVVQPPSVSEYGRFVTSNLRAIATGMHVTYEDLTGDFSEVNFSSARLARLKHWARVEDWRWQMLVPQFCDPVWAWAMEALQLMGEIDQAPAARWTPPPMPMIEPDKEGLAYQRNIRTGIQSWSESVRERGYDPDELIAEIKSDNDKLDKAGIVLDSDPRRMTQAGQYQSTGGSATTGGAA